MRCWHVVGLTRSGYNSLQTRKSLDMTTAKFNINYKQIEDLLFGFAMKLTKDKERAKDLMQETFCRAFKNKDRFSENTNFKAWMTTIMRNNFINDYRKRKTRSQVMAPVEDFSYFIENQASVGNGDSIIMMKELNGLIGELPNDLQQAFKMYVNGYHYNEIAETVNAPIGTIKSRIFFARKKLRASIKANYNMTHFNRA